MAALPLPRERAWQAVLVMTGLASLIHGAQGEYLKEPGEGGSEAEGGWQCEDSFLKKIRCESLFFDFVMRTISLRAFTPPHARPDPHPHPHLHPLLMF